VARVVVREDYRAERLAILRSYCDPAHASGLEIGASDLPTVCAGQGQCEFADWRSTEELARELGMPIASLAPVTYVLDRGRALHEQIGRTFDYVVLCHVLEHVADPIGYLTEVAQLVRPGGVLLLAIPDKEQTRDGSRPSTTIDHLLARHHHRESVPSLQQIMEFSRAWWDEEQMRPFHSPRAFLNWAVSVYESGTQDAHCNVWRDEEFFTQLDLLIGDGFLPGLEVAERRRTMPPLSEFHVVLRKMQPAADPLESR
jgi:SAM-dependent methyltransferase